MESEAPKFDYQTTVDKLKHWKESASGPTTCAKFDVDGRGL